METEYEVIGKKNKKSSALRQLFVCVTACLFYFVMGLGMGSPTVVVPQLRNEANSTAAVSEDMASWITSILGFSSIPSVFILVITSHLFGRKKPWFLVAVNTFVSFTLFYFSKNVMHLFISQLLLGFTFASQMSISLMVITKCASPRYRGILLASKTATFYWGLWCANAIGTFFHYKYIGLVGILCSGYNFISIFFIPETPFWLASKGRYDECAKAHRWLKGDDDDAEHELEALTKHQEDAKQDVQKCNSILSYCKNYIHVMVQPEFYKPVSMAFIIICMYQMSGKFVFAVYAIEMLKKITNSQTMAYKAMLILDGFSVLGMYIGSYFTKIFKRRPFLLVSSMIAAVIIFIMSLYLYLVRMKVIIDNNYVSVSLLVIYSLAVCSGPLILSGTICNEMFPLRSRNFAILFVAVIKDFLIGSMLKFSPRLFKFFGFDGTFLFFGVMFSICIILAYKFIPETKDKTLNEISALFERK